MESSQKRFLGVQRSQWRHVNRFMEVGLHGPSERLRLCLDLDLVMDSLDLGLRLHNLRLLLWWLVLNVNPSIQLQGVKLDRSELLLHGIGDQGILTHGLRCRGLMVYLLLLLILLMLLLDSAEAERAAAERAGRVGKEGKVEELPVVEWLISDSAASRGRLLDRSLSVNNGRLFLHHNRSFHDLDGSQSGLIG